MDSDTESTKSHTESEEDLGCYFLEPASSPYNIAQRIHEANVDLYESNSHRTNIKMAKVKFREELVSFEPDSTDEDINSIESDHPEVSVETHPTILNYASVINADINIIDIEEEGEDFAEEEVIEETESECDEDVKHIEHVHKAEIKEISGNGTEKENETVRESSKKKIVRTRKTDNPREIHCKDHCIDIIDSDLSDSVRKLELQEKVNLPPLQLIERKCCDKVRSKFHTNLPNYTGLRSEYGLSSRELERREKQAEAIRLREQMRIKLLEEYRQRKIQQNEEVFLQWLREVGRRKGGNINTKKIKKGVSSKRVNSASSGSTATTKKKVKRRPKTAEEISKKPYKNGGQKPRPHTTHSCVYIEVPQSLLEQGLNIGNLTITSSKMTKRKLHILAIS